jgi:hypothetical protein
MFCSCSTYRKKACPHILKLVDLYRAFHKQLKGGTPDDDFRSSVWYRLARVLAEDCKETAHSVRMHFIGQRQGVQVFKLVTLGTLEEKISAIYKIVKRFYNLIYYLLDL